jgi:hypothetical protein
MNQDYSLYTTTDSKGNSLTTFITMTPEVRTGPHIPTSTETLYKLKHGDAVRAVETRKRKGKEKC